MTRQDLNKIAPLIKDKGAWDAYIWLLEYEEQKLLRDLISGNPDQLLRLSGKCQLIQHLKNARNNWLDVEKNL